MLTNLIALNVIQLISFGIFTYLGILIVEKLMRRKISSPWVYFACILINSSSLYFAASRLPILMTYLLLYIIFVMEILLIFREKYENVFYGAMAITINLMCFRGIVSSLFAIITGHTFLEIYSDSFMSLYVSLITSVVLLCLALWIVTSAPFYKIHIFIRDRLQKTYMLIWMTVCLILMLINANIYKSDSRYTELYVIQLFFCLSLIMSSYFSLILSYSLNRAEKIKSKYQRLTQELVTQKRLQSVLMQGSVFSCEANLTQNHIISGPYMESFAQSNFEYDKWFDVFKYNIHPEDRDYFFSFAGRERLIESFENGTEPPPFVYRRFDNGAYHWVKMVLRIFRDVETEDIFVYGYSYDVDEEMREKEELEKRATTDSLTNLLNRDTAEKK